MRWLAATFTPLVVFASAQVMAADLPVPPDPAAYAPAPVAGWSGFYIGANAGGGMSRAHSEFSVAGATFATADTDLWGPAGGVFRPAIIGSPAPSLLAWRPIFSGAISRAASVSSVRSADRQRTPR